MHGPPLWVLNVPTVPLASVPAGMEEPVVRSTGGYLCRSVHLPYLLDPLYERHGPWSRLWRVEARDVRLEGGYRVRVTEGRLRRRVPHPKWVGGPDDVRVRLRFAVLAAAETEPDEALRGRLRALELDDLLRAAETIEATLRGRGRDVSQSLWLAAKAVRTVARGDALDLDEMLSPPYAAYAWQAAMAVAVSSADLDSLAARAVSRHRLTGRDMSAYRSGGAAGGTVARPLL